MSVEATLEERGARYGAFINHAEIAQGLQAIIQKAPNWPTLDFDMRQALVTITDKIARILNGDPYYGDNWHDIQGYAKLVEDRLLLMQAEPAENEIYSVQEDIMPSPGRAWQTPDGVPISHGWPSGEDNPNVKPLTWKDMYDNSYPDIRKAKTGAIS